MSGYIVGEWLPTPCRTRIECAARVGEDRGVGGQQIRAFHSLSARLGAEQQRHVDAFECPHRVVADLDAGEQFEGTVDEHGDDLGLSRRSARPDFGRRLHVCTRSPSASSA
jgi:hypothetical protein